VRLFVGVVLLALVALPTRPHSVWAAIPSHPSAPQDIGDAARSLTLGEVRDGLGDRFQACGQLGDYPGDIDVTPTFNVWEPQLGFDLVPLVGYIHDSSPTVLLDIIRDIIRNVIDG